MRCCDRVLSRLQLLALDRNFLMVTSDGLQQTEKHVSQFIFLVFKVTLTVSKGSQKGKKLHAMLSTFCSSGRSKLELEC